MKLNKLILVALCILAIQRVFADVQTPAANQTVTQTQRPELQLRDIAATVPAFFALVREHNGNMAQIESDPRFQSIKGNLGSVYSRLQDPAERAKLMEKLNAGLEDMKVKAQTGLKDLDSNPIAKTYAPQAQQVIDVVLGAIDKLKAVLSQFLDKILANPMIQKLLASK